jgi:two-component system, NarL family, response regulator LiaR
MAVKPIRVLIVDDYPLFADALKMALDRDPDMEVVGVASSGAEAIDMAVANDAQVVLMDIGLPDVDGYEATRRLHTIKAARVIAMTGRSEEETLSSALDAGMVSYLSKDHIADHVHDAILRASVS